MTICVKCKYHSERFRDVGPGPGVPNEGHFCGHPRHYRIAPGVSFVTGEPIEAVKGRCEDINMGNCQQYEAKR